MMYDVWCMMYDVWCMMYDVWCMMWHNTIHIRVCVDSASGYRYYYHINITQEHEQTYNKHNRQQEEGTQTHQTQDIIDITCIISKYRYRRSFFSQTHQIEEIGYSGCCFGRWESESVLCAASDWTCGWYDYLTRTQKEAVVYDVWCMMCDVWCMMYDVWCIRYDVWCMTYDVWCMIYDIWCIMYNVTHSHKEWIREIECARLSSADEITETQTHTTETAAELFCFYSIRYTHTHTHTYSHTHTHTHTLTHTRSVCFLFTHITHELADVLINVGGPVSTLDWCPTGDQCTMIVVCCFVCLLLLLVVLLLLLLFIIVITIAIIIIISIIIIITITIIIIIIPHRFTCFCLFVCFLVCVCVFVCAA